MADIEIETSEVKALVAEIEQLFSELSSKIAEFNQKKDTIADYWSSREAKHFIEQLDKVNLMFDAFEKEYKTLILLKCMMKKKKVLFLLLVVFHRANNYYKNKKT